MVRSSLPMNTLAYGGAILVPMEAPRIWCICVSVNLQVLFEDEIEYDAHYMGRWTICG